MTKATTKKVESPESPETPEARLAERNRLALLLRQACKRKAGVEAQTDDEYKQLLRAKSKLAEYNQLKTDDQPQTSMWKSNLKIRIAELEERQPERQAEIDRLADDIKELQQAVAEFNGELDLLVLECNETHAQLGQLRSQQQNLSTRKVEAIAIVAECYNRTEDSIAASKEVVDQEKIESALKVRDAARMAQEAAESLVANIEGKIKANDTEIERLRSLLPKQRKAIWGRVYRQQEAGLIDSVKMLLPAYGAWRLGDIGMGATFDDFLAHIAREVQITDIEFESVKREQAESIGLMAGV
jgi:chromosome segregation ATPase